MFVIVIQACNNGSNTPTLIANSQNIKSTVSTQPVLNLLPDDPVLLNLGDTVSEKGPKNITRCIYRDHNGKLWLASWQGIICYDGKLFTNITLKQGLGHYPYCCVFEDRQNTLWFGTMRKGAYRYKDNQFVHYTAANGLAGNSVFCIMQDEQGRIWFGTDEGLSCYTDGRFVNYTTKDGLPDNRVYSMQKRLGGELWFGTAAGLSTYKPQPVGYTNTDAGLKFINQKLPFSNIRCMLKDTKGNIWLGTTNGGLSLYNGKEFRYFSKNEGLSSNFVSCLHEDKEGTIWVGGDVHSFDGNKFERLQVKAGQNCDNVFCIYQNPSGNLLFGSSDGVICYDGKLFRHL